MRAARSGSTASSPTNTPSSAPATSFAITPEPTPSPSFTKSSSYSEIRDSPQPRLVRPNPPAPRAAPEIPTNKHHQNDGSDQRLLHIADGSSNGGGAIHHHRC